MRKKVAVCCGIYIKHINTLCGPNTDFLMLKQIVRCAVQDGYGMWHSTFTRNESCQSANHFHSCSATHLNHKVRRGDIAILRRLGNALYLCLGDAWFESRFIVYLIPQSLQENAEILRRLGHDRFLPHPFQLTSQQSSYYPRDIGLISTQQTGVM
jgi:hypothetical protein